MKLLMLLFFFFILMWKKKGLSLKIEIEEDVKIRNFYR